MKWQLNKNRPIVPQLHAQICVKIALGEYVAQERIPSIRELAVEVGVTPNTVQRAFEILEQQSIIYSIKGVGYFVSQNTDAAKVEVEKIKLQKAQEYYSAMAALGISALEAKEFIGGITI